MISASGRYVMTYNGEIYGYANLRSQLKSEGYPFKGHSDTEVLLAAIECWGLQRALELVQGMFAFAVWDREQRQLSLARDRAGKKPLYYGWSGDAFLFTSELKALRLHPEFDDTIDRNALAQFIQYGWIPEPLSIYHNVRKLTPGSYVTVKAEATPWKPSVKRYWAANRVMENARARPFQGGFEQAAEHLDELLTTAVTERMVADVDLGALLSGGIDSSTVVGIMQKHSDRPIKTFCIGFEDKKYNEAGYAADIARYLGTDHHELYVTPRECLAVVDRLSGIYDEPFADPSQIPTMLVAQMASQQVKVVLSGDGGDETFAGYKRHLEGLEQWHSRSKLPDKVKMFSAELLTDSGNQSWRLFKPSQPFGEQKMPAWKKFGGKLQRRTRGWRAATPQAMMAAHLAHTPYPQSLVIGSSQIASHMSEPLAWSDNIDSLSAMLQFDFVGYMVGDILVKVDRATMAASLEARCPLLDTRVTEFAWTLPNKYLIDNNGGKRILRHVLERYVPRNFTDRPKRGFGVPIDHWLRGPLRDWVESLISEQKLRDFGYFQPEKVRCLWEQHLCGWRNNSNILWSIIMFQAWFNKLKLEMVQ